METADRILGVFIIVGLISLALSYFLPKEKFANYFRINERFFIFANIVGIICGSFGIAATFMFTPDAVRSYLWRFICFPWVYLQLYIILIMSIRKTIKIYDEKQGFNMANAAAVTLGFMAVVVILIEQLLQNGLFDIKLILPFYYFCMIFIYSMTTVVLFRKA